MISRESKSRQCARRPRKDLSLQSERDGEKKKRYKLERQAFWTTEPDGCYDVMDSLCLWVSIHILDTGKAAFERAGELCKITLRVILATFRLHLAVHGFGLAFRFLENGLYWWFSRIGK